MPLFKFKHSKKSKEVPKKASSMNNIYNDYSGGSGAAKKEVNFEETDEIKQFNGRCISTYYVLIFLHGIEKKLDL